MVSTMFVRGYRIGAAIVLMKMSRPIGGTISEQHSPALRLDGRGAHLLAVSVAEHGLDGELAGAQHGEELAGVEYLRSHVADEVRQHLLANHKLRTPCTHSIIS